MQQISSNVHFHILFYFCYDTSFLTGHPFPLKSLLSARVHSFIKRKDILHYVHKVIKIGIPSHFIIPFLQKVFSLFMSSINHPTCFLRMLKSTFISLLKKKICFELHVRSTNFLRDKGRSGGGNPFTKNVLRGFF